MKKYLLLICLFLFSVSGCAKQDIEKYNEYFYQINGLVQNFEFTTAKVENGKITLYDVDNEIVDKLNFEEYDADINLLYIRKEENVIYFITSGAVDDEEGVIFVNNGDDDFLDGIKTLDRIGGNSYKYSTRK